MRPIPTAKKEDPKTAKARNPKAVMGLGEDLDAATLWMLANLVGLFGPIEGERLARRVSGLTVLLAFKRASEGIAEA